jgi:hypothetical protein
MTEVPDLIDKRATLTGVRAFARFVVIGAVLLAAAGAFAYVGGWFSPNRLILGSPKTRPAIAPTDC